MPPARQFWAPNVAQTFLAVFFLPAPILLQFLSLREVLDPVWYNLQLVWPMVDYIAKQAETYPTPTPGG